MTSCAIWYGSGTDARRSRLRPSWTGHRRRPRKKGARGYDGAKRLKGRKRHVLVDTGGLVLKAVVHPANIPDREGARLVLSGITARFPHLTHLWVDAGYTGQAVAGIGSAEGLTVQNVRKPRRWFRVPIDQDLPRRWVVERTFAWLGRWRRLGKDYEELPTTEEA